MSRDATTEPAIDRITPTLRPDATTRMRQTWSHLLFLHWALPVAALRPLVPDGLEIDTSDGRAYVGLIPFTLSGVRPWWLPPIPGLSSFHEVNVRTYVHRDGRDPGVWFFSLDASNPVAVALARSLWHLPYRHARMSLELGPGADRVIRYRSERRGDSPTAAGCRMAYTPTGATAPAAPGTLDHFLVERYFLYCRRGEALLRGQVHHAPYPLQGAAVSELEETLIAAAGITRPATPPLAHYSPGVRVRVYRLEKVG
jgi:uncharacterized protein YqjF (DUF2071 family)